MPGWKSVLKADPTEWVLSEGQPWVVYHTLVDILDKGETDPDVVAAKAALAVDHSAGTRGNQEGQWIGSE